MRSRPALVLLLAIVGISVAAPLIRLSSAHPVAIAVWRLVISLGILGVGFAGTRGWRAWGSLSGRDVAIALGAGAMLAIHFWSWNTSLLYTSIAASVILVNLQPALVAVLSSLWLRETPTRRQWTGIAIAIAGAAGVAFASTPESAQPGSAPLRGNALALVGAIAAALYYLSGRRLRAKLDLVPYVSLVYGACLVALLGIALAVDAPLLPQPRREWAIFAGLALGPMLLGHTGMNWALRHLPAYVVNIAVLGEPVGAILLAALLPGIQEVPSMGVLAAGSVVILGILMALPRRELPS
ncbi:MAG TPA: DMT family transporter [Gemmatimonadaceae bacterium]|nr:DMT family transporter [Gemmatimonadaceae bacterium]